LQSVKQTKSSRSAYKSKHTSCTLHNAHCTLPLHFCSQFFICLIANVQLPSSCIGTTRNVRSLETVTLSTTKLFHISHYHISHYHYPQKSAYELVNITLLFRFTGQASSGSLCFSATSLSSRRDIASPNRELIRWSTSIMATSLFLPKDDR
jgi:hypothetical protein